MSDEYGELERETQPQGNLVPPSRRPPTAVGADSPLPPPPARRPQRQQFPLRRRGLVGAVERVLDVLDVLGDTIAEQAGLRGRR